MNCSIAYAEGTKPPGGTLSCRIAVVGNFACEFAVGDLSVTKHQFQLGADEVL